MSATLTPASTKQLEAARTVIRHLAGVLDSPVSVRLWDGSLVPLTDGEVSKFCVAISGPGVIASLLRKPTLENFVRHYGCGHLEVQGGDLFEFGKVARVKRTKARLKQINVMLLLRQAMPFLFAKADKPEVAHAFEGDSMVRNQTKRANQDFVQFHYDLGNEFYELFLDPEMQYSCAYFDEWTNTLEQAQRDKLDMICRKLRMKPGEKFLDIGCGWGGLLCHAARNYGVHAHGVTLSQEQFDFVQAKVKRLGLEGKVTVELRDYTTLEGTYDKIASIGMFEHVGIANMRTYFKKIYSLLRDRGILLNHGIARGAKKSQKAYAKQRPEHKLIAKYIFPGGELDHIGHTLESLESTKFEVHDVEGWREHYARTTQLWCQRLTANKEKAVALVGPEKYRMWVAYLACVSFSFTDGSLRIFQVVASKHSAKGNSELPPSRRDLYAA